MLCFPCVNPSVYGFPPRGHTGIVQHLVNTVPIPPLSFCLCQHLETLRVTLAFLIWAGCKSVQRCVDGQSIPFLIVFYVCLFLWDSADWYPNRVQLKSIWNVARTFSTFHGCDKATGHGRLLWNLEADTWFEFGGDACFLQQAKQMSLEMNTLRSAFGWLSYHRRTRNDTCKLWLKRAGCLLQTLLHFHFKWEVLCTINQRGMLRGSTLWLSKAFKEWEHGCSFPFPLPWHNLSRCLTADWYS